MNKTALLTVASLAPLIILLSSLSASANKMKPQSSPTTISVHTVSQTVSDTVPSTDSTPMTPLNHRQTSEHSSTAHQPQVTPTEAPYSDIRTSISAIRTNLKETALSFLGTPYRWGGTTPKAFDCSGFTRYVYAQHGIHIPRTARQQYKHGTPVRAGTWKTGDLVFFDIKKGCVSHVGLYLTSCAFIHASNPLCGVKIDTLKKPNYKKYYVGARVYDLT